MCGILYVESRTTRPLPQHLAAVEILKSRGPDFVRYQHQGRVFIAQTVLHAQTSLPTTEKFTTTAGMDVTAVIRNWRTKQPETIATGFNTLKDPGRGYIGTVVV